MLCCSRFALSAAADVDQDMKVSKVASPDFGLLDVRHNNGDGRRSLRTSISNPVGEEDNNEERLVGANMFNAGKIKTAIGDAKYAKTLFQRWKRHGFDSDKAFKKLNAHNIGKNDDVFKLYQTYFAWLQKHHPTDGVGGKNMFAPAKLEKAKTDATYARTLFDRWKRHGLDSDDVFKKFQAMGVRNDDDLYRVYTTYFTWLNLHHPSSSKVSTNTLFESARLKMAMEDPKLAERLFAKWKKGNWESDAVFKEWAPETTMASISSTRIMSNGSTFISRLNHRRDKRHSLLRETLFTSGSPNSVSESLFR